MYKKQSPNRAGSGSGAISGGASAATAAEDEDRKMRKLFVDKLSADITEGDIYEVFEKHGEIEEIAKYQDRRAHKRYFAFVVYKNAKDCYKATADPLPVIKGQKCACMLAAIGKQFSGYRYFVQKGLLTEEEKQQRQCLRGGKHTKKQRQRRKGKAKSSKDKSQARNHSNRSNKAQQQQHKKAALPVQSSSPYKDEHVRDIMTNHASMDDAVPAPISFGEHAWYTRSNESRTSCSSISNQTYNQSHNLIHNNLVPSFSRETKSLQSHHHQQHPRVASYTPNHSYSRPCAPAIVHQIAYNSPPRRMAYNTSVSSCASGSPLRPYAYPQHQQWHTAPAAAPAPAVAIAHRVHHSVSPGLVPYAQPQAHAMQVPPFQQFSRSSGYVTRMQRSQSYGSSQSQSPPYMAELSATKSHVLPVFPNCKSSLRRSHSARKRPCNYHAPRADAIPFMARPNSARSSLSNASAASRASSAAHVIPAEILALNHNLEAMGIEIGNTPSPPPPPATLSLATGAKPSIDIDSMESAMSKQQSYTCVEDAKKAPDKELEAGFIILASPGSTPSVHTECCDSMDDAGFVLDGYDDE